MKVKILGTAHPFRGGLAAYNERLAREYIKLGDIVSIETFIVQYPNFFFPGKSQFSNSPPPEGLNIKRTINSINPLNWIIIGNRIKRERPDIVIIKYWLPFMAPALGTIAKLIRKNNFTKIICIADNIIPHEKRPGDNFLTNYFIQQLDGVIAQSKSVYNDVFKFTKKIKVSLCPHPMFDNFGVILSREKAIEMLDLDPKYRYILFFGFIRDYKGLDLILKAMSDFQLKSLNVKLIVAGEFYSNSELYLKMIDDLDIKDKIILKTNFIADDEVNKYFCCADIVAQPYKHATQSGVTQIGYHFNKPMLVTNVGGLPEIIPHGVIGYVVEPQEKAISDALFDFFTTDKKSTFETNILKEKKRFQWSTMTTTISDTAFNKI